MDSIQSAKNPRLKAAARLRDRGERRRQGKFLIDGLRELDRARQAGVTLEEVFFCSPWLTTPEAHEIAQQAAAAAEQAHDVAPAAFERLTFGDRADGVVAVARRSPRTLADMRWGPQSPAPLVCILEGIEKPGNLGAILRSADGAGVSAVIVTGSGTDLENPNTIRASLGTVFSLPTVAADASEIVPWLLTAGPANQAWQIVTARVEGRTPYTAVDFRRPTALVLGSETAGLSSAWNLPEVIPVSLPMLGIADSLNVSTAAAVLFYEALRQRSESTHSATQPLVNG